MAAYLTEEKPVSGAQTASAKRRWEIPFASRFDGIAFAIGLILLMAALVALAAWHNVPTSVAPRDAAAARALLRRNGLPLQKPTTFAGQLEFVMKVQDAVISAAPFPAPKQPGIPLGQPRELTNLIGAPKALCFDRSRAIETVLRVAGFKVRHFNLYSTWKTHSALRSIVEPNIPSHSLTEVLTDKGWMMIDSNWRYVGLSANGTVFGISQLRAHPDIELDPRFTGSMPGMLRKPFVQVYGLYSRHGRFYPPYDPIPDVNWRELLDNFG